MQKSASSEDILQAIASILGGDDALEVAERLADLRQSRQRLQSVISAAMVLQSELELVESMIEDAVDCGASRGW